MNFLYKKMIISSLLMTSIPLQTGHKKIVYSPEKPIKGVLKTASDFRSSSAKKELKFAEDIGEISNKQFLGEVKKPQEWQTDEEYETALMQKIVVELVEGDVKKLALKSHKYDKVVQENKRLKRFIAVSSGMAITAAFYYFSMMKNSDEEL